MIIESITIHLDADIECWGPDTTPEIAALANERLEAALEEFCAEVWPEAAISITCGDGYQHVYADGDDEAARRIEDWIDANYAQCLADVLGDPADDLHQQVYDAIASARSPHYGVGHTCDQHGGRYAEPILEPAASLKEAEARAEEYTAAGQCGYVMRQDGAVLGPDGTWLSPEQ